MAKIKQGILGGFSGKVANVVGTSWKGRAVMKSQPLSVANPRTEAQQEQRGKFSKIAELASAVLTQFVQPVENPISGNISGYNLFCKDNKGAFNASGKLVAADFVAGGGKIINLESVECSLAPNQDEPQVEWGNSEGLSAIRLTDKVYALLVSEDGSIIFANNESATREVEVLNLALVKGVATYAAGTKFMLLTACVSADGRDVSVKTTATTITAA